MIKTIKKKVRQYCEWSTAADLTRISLSVACFRVQPFRSKESWALSRVLALLSPLSNHCQHSPFGERLLGGVPAGEVERHQARLDRLEDGYRLAGSQYSTVKRSAYSILCTIPVGHSLHRHSVHREDLVTCTHSLVLQTSSHRFSYQWMSHKRRPRQIDQ